MDGALFEVMIKNGYTNLRNHEREINKMNIFPVPDGDTGYNMRQTLENGIKNAKPDKHLGEYLKGLSKGMLLGARGNSGVILSQLFSGLAKEVERNGYINAGELKNALVRAYKTAYSAVQHPVEGTILTVAREGIEGIRSQIRRGTTVSMVFSAYLAEMKKSVYRTPEMLGVLKEAGVLDSGAVGYVTIFEGMVKGMYGETVRPLFEVDEDLALETASDFTKNGFSKKGFSADGVFEYGYCLEFLLQLLSAKTARMPFNVKNFTEELKTMGNSLVVVTEETIVKVHIHTFEPEKIMAFSRLYGEFVSFKLENMQVQHEEYVATSGEKNQKSNDNPDSADTVVREDMYAVNTQEAEEVKPLAIVAVADGEGISEMLSSCGADVILRGGQTMNTPAKDFVEAYESLNAERILVLPNNANIVETAVQAAVLCGKKDIVTVLPTGSVLEGYYGLALGTMDVEDVDERIALIEDGAKSVQTVCVARAVKNYESKTFSCKEGDYIGFIGKKLVSASKDRAEALVSALKKIADVEDKSSFIVLTGAKITERDEELLDAALENALPSVPREFVFGGQSAYDVIVGVV